MTVATGNIVASVIGGISNFFKPAQSNVPDIYAPKPDNTGTYLAIVGVIVVLIVIIMIIRS